MNFFFFCVLVVVKLPQDSSSKPAPPDDLAVQQSVTHKIEKCELCQVAADAHQQRIPFHINCSNCGGERQSDRIPMAEVPRGDIKIHSLPLCEKCTASLDEAPDLLATPVQDLKWARDVDPVSFVYDGWQFQIFYTGPTELPTQTTKTKKSGSKRRSQRAGKKRGQTPPATPTKATSDNGGTATELSMLFPRCSASFGHMPRQHLFSAEAYEAASRRAGAGAALMSPKRVMTKAKSRSILIGRIDRQA